MTQGSAVPQRDSGAPEPAAPDADERRRLIDFATGPAIAIPDLRFHEMIGVQAVERPNATAIRCAGKQITYLELHERANRLANFLVANGVELENVVAVCLDRSIDSIVALLAAMSAGGAYLPLDPQSAPDRLRLILESSRPAAIITQRRLCGALQDAGADPKRLIALDERATQIAQCPATAPPVPVAPENLAYLIYTSGSTGQPKGVLIEHKGLSNLVAVVEHGFDVGPADRVLLYHSLSFDFSIWEIAMALPFGATLCMTGPAFSAFELESFLLDNGITIASLTSSALQFMDGLEFPDLHTLATGAESCSVETAQYWSARCRFYHGYGPTEATTGCAYEEYGGTGPVTIGRPWPNMQVHLLDPNFEPTPIGALGEIFIGGVGLARGYLGDRALTESRFIANPFLPGERLYRTGDLARRLENGTLVFAGREDEQVKIVGYRVELGEIENALASHPSVKQAVVSATGGEVRQLIAYFVPAEGSPADEAAMRRHLELRLPGYMMPSAFVKLASMPLTSSGKIDRRALGRREAQPQ